MGQKMEVRGSSGIGLGQPVSQWQRRDRAAEALLADEGWSKAPLAGEEPRRDAASTQRVSLSRPAGPPAP